MSSPSSVRPGQPGATAANQGPTSEPRIVATALVPKPREVRPWSTPTLPPATPQPSRLLPVTTRSTKSFSAWFRAWLTQAFEGVVKWAARNNHSGQTYGVDLHGKRGNDLLFKVGERIGHGVFGVVYHVGFTCIRPEARRAHPLLFSGDKPRTDLVVKFPNRVPWPLPAFLNPWKLSILGERNDGKRIDAALGTDAIPGSAILFEHMGRIPFLIKPFLKAEGLTTLARRQACLTDDQAACLEALFEKAERLGRAADLNLDIKAENIGWQPAERRFVVYEKTVLPPGLGKFFMDGGFERYRQYFDQRLQEERSKLGLS